MHAARGKSVPVAQFLLGLGAVASVANKVGMDEVSSARTGGALLSTVDLFPCLCPTLSPAAGRRHRGDVGSHGQLLLLDHAQGHHRDAAAAAGGRRRHPRREPGKKALSSLF